MNDISFVGKSSLYKSKRIIQNIPLFRVSLEINGGTLTNKYFLLDTGSNASIIHAKSLELLKINVVDSQLKFIEVNVLNFETVKVNESLKLYIDDKATLSTETDFPNNIGLIGIDFFKARILNINYQKKQFSFKYSQLSNPIKNESYEFKNHFLFLNINISGEKYSMCFDTGMNGDYILFEKSLKNIELESMIIKENHYGRGHQGNQYEIIHYNEEVDLTCMKTSFKSNIKILKNHPFFEQYDFDGIIGNDFFNNQQIEIDFLNETFNVK